MITVENKPESKNDVNAFLNSLKIGDWFVLEWNGLPYAYHVLGKKTFDYQSYLLDLLCSKNSGHWTRKTYTTPLLSSSRLAITDFYLVEVPHLNVVRK